MLNFESIQGLTIAGNVTVVEDPAGFPQPHIAPTGVLTHIRTDQDFQFDFSWTQTGWLSCLICGQYEIEVCFEKCGAGEFSPTPASKLVPLTPGSGATYNASINFLAGDVPPGTYRVVACLILKDNMGNPAPVAGFEDLGLIKFYEFHHCC